MDLTLTLISSIHACVNLSTSAKQTRSDVHSFIEKMQNPAPNPASRSISLLPKNVLEFPKKEKDLYEELISFIEQFYQEHRKLPNQQDFARAFSPNQLPRSLEEW